MESEKIIKFFSLLWQITANAIEIAYVLVVRLALARIILYFSTLAAVGWVLSFLGAFFPVLSDLLALVIEPHSVDIYRLE